VKLSVSEDNLRVLKVQTGVMDVQDQEKALVDQLFAFRAQYRSNQSQLAGTNQRIDYLNRELTSYPERVDAETKVVQNMALQTLKPQVLQLEAERAELVSRYRPDSERIKSIDAKLQAAKAVLHREDTREVQEVSSTINPTWQSLSSELAEAKVN
jgi:chromosome segregation ATPase